MKKQKIIGWLKGLFGRPAAEGMVMADTVSTHPEDDEPKPKPIPKHKDTILTKTYDNCVVCGIPQARAGRQIRFTCSKVCRCMLRSGKANKRILMRQLRKGGIVWSKIQISKFANLIQ